MKKVKILNKFLFSFLSLLTVTGCATIMHGTRQSVGISSNPSNANVWVDRTYVGTSPLIVDMTRKDNHIVTIHIEGYQPYEAVFTRQLSGWALGNIIFGGVIGLAVDAISGGLYRLTPEQIQLEMQTNQMVYTKNSGESQIFVVLEPNPSWEKIGNLVALN